MTLDLTKLGGLAIKEQATVKKYKLVASEKRAEKQEETKKKGGSE